ncbi:hat family dimerization domain-containing protein, partial [Moniliophthora roreri MCA 2997]
MCIQKQEASEHPECVEVQTYGLKTSITNMCKHMVAEHLSEFIIHCDTLEIPIEADAIADDIARYHAENDIPAAIAISKSEKFTLQGLTDKLMELIIAEDLPITFIESEHVICLILYLRWDITKDDILRHTTMRKVIIDTFYSNMFELAKEAKKAIGKISFTCDCWTDINLYLFMAITTHWIEDTTITSRTSKIVETQNVLKFHSEVIAFHKVPVSHTGMHLAEAFWYPVNCLGLLKKVGWITCDNATNNDVMFSHLERHLGSIDIEFHEYNNHIWNNVTPHILGKYEWEVMKACEPILRAPHAFQHFLSREETPFLAFTVPGFHAVINKWHELQGEYPELYNVIQPGIEKLEDYLIWLSKVPAYFLSMLVNPSIKMRWIEQKLYHCKDEILRTFYHE